MECCENLLNVLVYCGKIYEEISNLNEKHGKTDGTFDHTLVYFIAGRALNMDYENDELNEKTTNMSQKKFAGKIFDLMDVHLNCENCNRRVYDGRQDPCSSMIGGVVYKCPIKSKVPKIIND